MIDQKTLAYVNLYAVLGALENLCELSPEAAGVLAGKKPVSIGFAIKNGPSATISFKGGKCRMDQGCSDCDVKLPFSSYEKFNGLIDGTTTPIPSKGFTRIGFLLGEFTKLTDLLTKFLRPDPADLENEDFLRTSVSLTFYVVSVALAQIANNDEIGKFTAGHMVDGEIAFNIKDGPASALIVKNHRLLALKRPCKSPRAVMEFSSIRLAKDLFDGKVNAVASIGSGDVAMKGMISMLDNLNRLLDRVALYLA